MDQNFTQVKNTRSEEQFYLGEKTTRHNLTKHITLILLLCLYKLSHQIKHWLAYEVNKLVQYIMIFLMMNLRELNQILED